MENNTKYINFDEYSGRKPAKFAPGQPTCKAEAVIPTLNVADRNGIKGLVNCLVHVDNINTTFYIDDKGRITIVWAGPVEAEDYDYINNPLNLRSQMVYDFNHNRAVYYGKTGNYRIITLKTGE